MFNAQTRVLICCALSSHLKHWNSWKGLSCPLLCTLLRHPLGACTYAYVLPSLSLSARSSIRTLSSSIWGLWIPYFTVEWPGQLSKTQNPFKMLSSVANAPQRWAVTTVASLLETFFFSTEILCLLAVTLSCLFSQSLEICILSIFPSYPGHWMLSGIFVYGHFYLVCL